MGRIYVKSERVVNGKPEVVYATLADYEEKRPLILTPNFLDYRVEQGGRGDGTVVSYRLQAARRERPYHMLIHEVVKGSVITEQDTNSSLITTWTVSPQEGGQQSRVRVTSEWEGGSGIGGFFERLFAPTGLSCIYGKMLAMLNATLEPADARNAEQQEHSPSTNKCLRLLMVGGIIALGVGATLLCKRRPAVQV
ncbi:MAG: SRPBCC family protein [Chloroflexi bacterium]|nr:MAG: SRPBCC family protein [Chloroflexota bacterium]